MSLPDWFPGAGATPDPVEPPTIREWRTKVTKRLNESRQEVVVLKQHVKELEARIAALERLLKKQ